MTRVFMSVNHKDKHIEKSLEDYLRKRGHTFHLGCGTKPAGRWEDKLFDAIHSADAFIGLLTENGLGSRWVVSQTATAIAFERTKNTLVLPVIREGAAVPDFVASLHCFFLKSESEPDIASLAEELNEAIVAHENVRRKRPRIFISHRHRDERVAAGLIRLIEAAFEIKATDIRCTSVPPYNLHVGATTSETLRSELEGAEVVIGLIGPETTQSDYVLFELGASWGLKRPTFPVRARKATYMHVPEVLRERSSLSLEDEAQCMQLVEDIARETTLVRRSESLNRVVQEAKTLAGEASREA